jgi:nitrite reductase/ring-hydroxylating ferredoxin subunit
MGRWIRVASRGDVPKGATLAVEADGESIFLYNRGGHLHARHALCTHDEASLADGYIEGDCIECPLHQARFHIPTGQVRAPPAVVDLRVFPVRLDGDDILVMVSEDGN